MKQIIITIYGRVQGVFFRDGVKREADKLNLVGWTRNTPEGTVEVLAEGEEENLKKLLDYCKEGPKFAKVEEVKVKWSEASGEFNEFMIKYD